MTSWLDAFQSSWDTRSSLESLNILDAIKLYLWLKSWGLEIQDQETYQMHRTLEPLDTQHKLDAIELCLWSSWGLEIQGQETDNRRIELHSLKSLWATRMFTTHQVLSYPKASILSSTASLVKLTSRVAPLGQKSPQRHSGAKIAPETL